MKLRREKPEPLRTLALYQRHWHDDGEHYRTSALLRHDGQWVVVSLDGEFRGEWQVTLHDRLEDARAAIIDWVGEPREVDASLVPGRIWERLNQWRDTGDLHADPHFPSSGTF